jgi:hypothetical protein
MTRIRRALISISSAIATLSTAVSIAPGVFAQPRTRAPAVVGEKQKRRQLSRRIDAGADAEARWQSASHHFVGIGGRTE